MTADSPVRLATSHDREAIVALFDATLLDIDRETVPDRIAREAVWVYEGDVRPWGAIMLDDESIEAIAVRPQYRHRGYGSALIEVAFEDRNRLMATCDPDTRAFYEHNGFVCHERDDGRIAGIKRS